MLRLSRSHPARTTASPVDDPGVVPDTAHPAGPRRWGRRLAAGALVLVMTSCAASAQGPSSSGLRDKARSQGTVLVIVTLRVPSGAAAATVEAVKQSLRGELASTRHRVVRELTGLPQIVLEASDDTLQVLNASAHVLRIDESTPEPPTR
jgi:hypothetical protein